MQLRPYQQKLIADIKGSLKKGNKSVVAVLGCGGGKSVIQAEIARSATDKGNRVLFLVHRRELCQQISNTFARQGVNMELCSVCMVQTVSRHIDDIPKPQIIITDEAHHSTANTYKKIYNRFPVVRLGFTATPCRLNAGGLGEEYDDLITSVSTRWLIENNFLVTCSERSKNYIKKFVEDFMFVLECPPIFGKQLSSTELMKQFEKEYDIDFSQIKVNCESKHEFYDRYNVKEERL